MYNLKACDPSQDSYVKLLDDFKVETKGELITTSGHLNITNPFAEDFEVNCLNFS